MMRFHTKSGKVQNPMWINKPPAAPCGKGLYSYTPPVDGLSLMSQWKAEFVHKLFSYYDHNEININLFSLFREKTKEVFPHEIFL